MRSVLEHCSGQIFRPAHSPSSPSWCRHERFSMFQVQAWFFWHVPNPGPTTFNFAAQSKSFSSLNRKCGCKCKCLRLLTRHRRGQHYQALAPPGTEELSPPDRCIRPVGQSGLGLSGKSGPVHCSSDYTLDKLNKAIISFQQWGVSIRRLEITVADKPIHCITKVFPNMNALS